MVLSIGKLKAGQAKYYLDQADARVDVVDSVAEGMEDYYLGAPETRGEWIGSAGLELRLSGAVEAEELRRVLAGLEPRRGLASGRADPCRPDLARPARRQQRRTRERRGHRRSGVRLEPLRLQVRDQLTR